MKSIKKIVSVWIAVCVLLLCGDFALAVEKSSAPAATEKAVKSHLININTAGADELMKLPRVGEKMARRIIEYRQQNGKFKKIQELMNVKGIGEKTFKGMEDMVTI